MYIRRNVNPSNIGLLSSGTAALAAYCNADPLSGVYDFNPAQITAAGLAAGAFSQIAIPSASTAPFLSNGYNVPAQYRKLFIGGLSHETSDDQLRDYYSKWGQVVDCIVIRDPVTRHSRGFGFVTYASSHMADIAMQERPHTINGKVVDPKRAIPRELMQTSNPVQVFLDSEVPIECKLSLSGLHWDYHTIDDLRDYFEMFGPVEQVEIVGQPRGYGFVVYEERSGVEKCLSKGRVHIINNRRVDVKEFVADVPHFIPSPVPDVLPSIPASLFASFNPTGFFPLPFVPQTHQTFHNNSSSVASADTSQSSADFWHYQDEAFNKTPLKCTGGERQQNSTINFANFNGTAVAKNFQQQKNYDEKSESKIEEETKSLNNTSSSSPNIAILKKQQQRVGGLGKTSPPTKS